MGLRSSPDVDRLGRPEKGCTINSLQGPGCLAKSGLCLPGLAGLRFGWLLDGFWLDIPLPGKISCFLAETGWTSPLPGGRPCEKLPLPQTKQSRWHNSTRGLAKQPRRRSRLGRPEKGCTSLTPCKAQAALPNQASACLVWLASGYQKKRVGFWLASGWLLAGFLVGHPPAWKNLVLTWLKLAGPPRQRGGTAPPTNEAK